MHSIINFNGRLIDRHTAFASVSNRSLRYGDGLFETMYWNGLHILNLEFHLDRLFQGLHILQFELNDDFTRELVAGQLIDFCGKDSPGNKSRVRLNVFREDGSLLNPVNNKPYYIIESSAISDDVPSPLRLTVFSAETKSTGVLSNLKTNNYLLNILAIQHAKKNGFDDAVLLNSRGNVCEASSSNLFMIQKGILFTPALSQGCVAGTKRRQLMETLPGLGFQIEETIITKDMLSEMEEVFITSAIRGIVPVICIDNTYYSRELSGMLLRLLDISGGVS